MEANEVIDLTQSFIYCRAPVNLNCAVIDLDDSIYASPRPVASTAEPIVCIDFEAEQGRIEQDINGPKKRKSTGIKKKKRSRNSVSGTSSETPSVPHYGDCPICRDPLGTRPMASTKCGHVYCISCIAQAVKIEKRCPTCRKPLKGATAYHPLFL